jgi:ribosome maturation factor RimP
MSSVLKKVLSVCEPVVNGMGYECVHLELAGGTGQKVLRFYIDKPDGVMVHDCTRVSKQLDVALDVDDVVSGAYTLEVSSPGLNRPLGRLKDFETHKGNEAKITTDAPIEGRRKWKGMLSGCSSTDVMIEVEGENLSIPFQAIKKANIEFNFEAVQS